MSDVDENRIAQVLTDDFMRRIVRACKEPQTSAEIIQSLRESQRQMMDDNYWERIVGDNLRRLSSLGGLIFASGKWKSAKEWLDALDKYFGGT